MLNKLRANPVLLSWVILIVLALIWGSSFFLIKIGLRVYPADQVASIRVFAAFLFLLPLAIPRLKGLNWYRVKWLFLSGLQGNFLPAYLFAFAQSKIDSAIAGIMNALTPIFTLLVGVLFYNQKSGWMKLTGVLVGFAGCAALMLGRYGFESMTANVFALLVVLATFFYGSNVNLLKYKLSDLNPRVTSSVALFLVGPIGGIYLATTDFYTITTETEGAGISLLAIVTLALFSTSIALILFNKLIQISTPTFASSVTYLMPVVALSWGVVLGESFGLIEVSGMLVILLGVLIVHRAK